MLKEEQDNLKRLTIDLPIQDHKRLKIMATVKGVSLKQLVQSNLKTLLYPKKKPNAETLAAFEESENLETMNHAEDLDDFIKQMESL